MQNNAEPAAGTRLPSRVEQDAKNRGVSRNIGSDEVGADVQAVRCEVPGVCRRRFIKRYLKNIGYSVTATENDCRMREF